MSPNEARKLLLAKLAELTNGAEGRSDLLIEHSADVVDTIRMAMDRDVTVQRLNMSSRTLQDVRRALAALEEGSYGICEDCESEIAPRRLAVMPWARVCVRCQEARDERAPSEDGGFSLAA